MNRSKDVRCVFAIGLGLWLGLGLGGCGPAEPGPGFHGPGPSVPKPGRTLRMGMMPKLMGISYFNACRKGAEEAARELGIALNFDGPPVDRVELQTQMVDEWIALGYDIIAVAPNDPEVIAPALRRAREAGIVTLTWDADANAESSGRAVFVNQAPVEEVGNVLVDLMANATGGKGKTVIVTGSATAPNQNAWMTVMERRLKAKYPEMRLLQTLVPEEDQNRARQMTLDVLNAHPDLAGIWGITSVALSAVAEAVHQAGRSGQVRVTGLSLPSTVKPYVQDGTVAQFVLWNPVDLGYLAVHVARRLAEKTLVPGTTSFGRLSDIRIIDDEVILGPPLVFDRSNIDRFDF
jgi:ABC-type sugar transport system substrate-binding protein